MVVAGHPLAARAGSAVLAAGGNAIDAAIATAAALGVVEPNMSGLGGDGFIMIARRDSRDGRGRQRDRCGPRSGGSRRLRRGDPPLRPAQRLRPRYPRWLAGGTRPPRHPVPRRSLRRGDRAGRWGFPRLPQVRRVRRRGLRPSATLPPRARSSGAMAAPCARGRSCASATSPAPSPPSRRRGARPSTAARSGARSRRASPRRAAC